MRLRQARALFTSSDRAVCRQMEEQYLVDKELKDLVTMATEQNWQVEGTGNGKLLWKSPDPQMRPVVTSIRLGNGRAKQNAMAELKRAGLKVGQVIKPDTDLVSATLNGTEIPVTETMKALVEAGVREDASMAKMVGSVLEAINIYVGSTHVNCADQLDEDLLKECDGLLQKIQQHDAQIQEMNKQRELLENKILKLETQASELGTKVRDLNIACAKEQERAHVAEQKLAQLRSIFKED